MTQKLTQTEEITTLIHKLLDSGMDKKEDIYTKVVYELGVPRPTVRRVARQVKEDMQKKVNVLSGIIEEKQDISGV